MPTPPHPRVPKGDGRAEPTTCDDAVRTQGGYLSRRSRARGPAGEAPAARNGSPAPSDQQNKRPNSPRVPEAGLLASLRFR
ncbi:hypothetical protein VTH06DRAFT_3551 [Thermothelomyces fergusii]